MDILQPANLVSWAFQAAVIVLVAAPLPRVLKMWSPRVRMAYWRVVLVGCLLLPLLQTWVVRQEAPPRALAAAVASADMTVHAPGGAAAAVPSAVPAAAPLSWLSSLDVTNVLAAGIVLRLAWLGLGVITVGRLRRSARRLWPRPPSVDRAATLAETDAEFLVSATASRPATCGLLWPVVLVPRNFESFPEHEQTAIACHELLHVSRGDWVRNAADEVLRALLWFHPAIWWVINEIQLAREQVVDREAVRLLGTRQAYLEALLRMARPAPRLILTPASLFLKRAHLRQRVTLLVKEASMSRARMVGSLAIMAIVILVGGRVATAAFPLQQSTGTRPGTETATQKPAAGATKPGVPTTGSAGVGSGVGGGVAGGVAGGVGGGVAGGVSGGVGSGQAPTPTASSIWAETLGTWTDKLVSRVSPSATGVSGTAQVYVTIDNSGHVSSTDFISAPGEAAVSSAVQAAKQWVFEPSPSPERHTVIAFNLSAPSPAPDTPSVRVGGSIPPPQRVRDAKPVYPREAQDAGIQGVQILEISVDPAGTVTDARALRGSRILLGAAIDAVMQWKFAEWSGPERRLMTVTVNFTLADGPAAKLGATPAPAALVPPGTDASPAPGVPYGPATDWPADASRIGKDLRPPTKIVDAKPVYPKEAQDARVQGVVILECLIGRDGKVQDARVVRSIPMLDQAAYDAVRQWEFTPTLREGEAIPIIMTVTVNFTLQ